MIEQTWNAHQQARGASSRGNTAVAATQPTHAGQTSTRTPDSEHPARLMSDPKTGGNDLPRSFGVRVLRQNGPSQNSYWERDINVISGLQRMATRPDDIKLRPMSKFPVLQDLSWTEADSFARCSGCRPGCRSTGTTLRQWLRTSTVPGRTGRDLSAKRVHELCCCLEACPLHVWIELRQQNDESQEEFAARQNTAYDRNSLGTHAISQVMLFNNHPISKISTAAYLNALTDEDGLQLCDNTQNCVSVCPKEIPLTTSIAHTGRAMTLQMLGCWLVRPLDARY